MVSHQQLETIRVAILDDHQSTIDGYSFRLRDHENIEVVATARFGCEVEGILTDNDVDLLVLDISMPTSEDDSNPYPLLVCRQTKWDTTGGSFVETFQPEWDYMYN